MDRQKAAAGAAGLAVLVAGATTLDQVTGDDRDDEITSDDSSAEQGSSNVGANHLGSGTPEGSAALERLLDELALSPFPRS